MRKKLFLLFGIFILLIIPNNVHALTGSYILNKSQAYYYNRADATDFYAGSVENSTQNTNSNGPWHYYYYKAYYNYVTSQNGETTYAPAFIHFFNGGSIPMSITNSQADIDFTIQYGFDIYAGTSGTLLDLSWQYVESAMQLQPYIVGTDINDEQKIFYCTPNITDYQNTAQNGRYYKLTATCNTSNFKSIDYFNITTGWRTIDTSTSLSINFMALKLQYETQTYTGTQDGNGFTGGTTGGDSNEPLDNISDSINDINDNITDDTVDTQFQNSTMNDINGQLATNNVISDLLLLPVRMYQSILNSINGTCTPFNLGSLYGTTLIMPCIQPQNYIGSALWGVIDILFCGFFILAMRKKFVDIFNNMTNLKNRGNELE